jgi:biopolymer transport protein ExbD
MALQTNSSHHMMSEINVTPLVDVMLVLLIVFIVTAPLLIQAVPLTLPKTAQTSPVQKMENLSLSVNREGHTFLDTRAIAVADIETTLAARLRAQPEINVLIQADEAVDFGRVAELMALVQRAGITRLSVVTVPQ